jgi:hypothetical protein
LTKRPPTAQLSPNARKNTQGSLAKRKRLQALTLLESVVLEVNAIDPTEYQVLTQVEAATVLWELDRPRAVSMLRRAVTTLRNMLEQKNETTEVNPYNRSNDHLLWFLVVRKIAALDPNLMRELLMQEAGDKADNLRNLPKLKGTWTEEARATLSVASELIDKDPRRAALIAEQALSLGLASYLTFLEGLAKRDNTEAERLAMVVIDRLSDVSVSPTELRNLGRFFFAPERTLRLRNYFYQAVAARLSAEIRPDATSDGLASALGVAETMDREAGRDSPYWKQQFDGIRSSILMLFKELSLPLPNPPGRVSLDVSALLAASEGDTTDIRDALFRVRETRDASARDREYQKLAVSAATRADKGLAEEIMSMINDDRVRFETATMVYSPLIRAAIKNSQWGPAQELASLIRDPLARSLVFIGIAEGMTKAGADRLSVTDAYSFALRKFYRDDPTDRLAKAYLLIAGPLLELDRDRGIEAIRSSMHTVDTASTGKQPLEESTIGSATSVWVRYRDTALNADEVLNLPELLTATFTQVAERDTDGALEIASWIKHRGMYSLAELAVVKVLLKQASNHSVQKGRRRSETR